MFTERRYKKRLHRNRPFILIGNEIDGRIDCKLFYLFENLKALKETLPEILVQIKGEGEWVFELYQVPGDYKIRHRWGYYRYPNHGIKILEHSYMNLPIKAVQFRDHEISFIGAMKSDEDYNRYVKSNVEVEINRITWKWK